MGLFSRHTYNIGGNAKQYQMDYLPCGETCKTCGKGPGCTKQTGHTTTFDGHSSNASTKVNGENGCGHTWH